jgi:hypothetical protein
MLKPLTILFFLVSILSRLNAASIQDTSLPVKYKSQQWFQTKYGRDDTSKAIIDYFFLKRQRLLTPLLISAGLTLTIGVTALFTAGPGKNDIAYDIGLILGGSFFFSAFFVLLMEYLNYTKRKLIKTLDHYRSGKGIPKRLSKVPSWQKFMKLWVKP